MDDPARRKPRQKRSKETREAIVEAAARVFAETGLAGATTARIAEVAGVSPGSMYQYFPSKDSLVDALFERENAEHHAKFLTLAAEMGTGDVRALIRAFVAWQLELFDARRPLYRVLIEEVPRLYGLEPSRQIDVLASRSLRLLLELGKDRIAARDLDFAAILLVRTFRYCAIPTIVEPLAPERREAFVDELTDLLTSYLLAKRD